MTDTFADARLKEFNAERMRHWDKVAHMDLSTARSRCYYHDRLTEVYRFLIPEGQRVLELGCGQGDLLASLKPAHGVGVDFSAAMLATARQRHAGLTFLQGDAHDPPLDEVFDAIVLSDVINDVYDVHRVFETARRFSHSRTRVFLNFFSFIWKYPLTVAERMGGKIPVLEQSWLAPHDVKGFLDLAGFEMLRSWQEVIFPLDVPGLSPLMNRYLAKLWPLNHLALTTFMSARPRPDAARDARPHSVSVVVPARNEAGNIEAIFERVPEMGSGTELIFVEGHSTDDTAQVIEAALERHPHRNAKLLRQPGKGKADAVRLGFQVASGDILMILDADITVSPEELPRFYQALVSGTGEFINGVRLVYPLEKQSMRLANLIANKAFGLTFSWLLGQRVKDTLCGTKVLWRQDYASIVAGRAYFGDFDPFGDFELLFGADKCNLKIIDMPVRYRERTYGQTNIQRWRHGVVLLRMVLFAAKRLKFI